jgi:hypothetical protein
MIDGPLDRNGVVSHAVSTGSEVQHIHKLRTVLRVAVPRSVSYPTQGHCQRCNQHHSVWLEDGGALNTQLKKKN